MVLAAGALVVVVVLAIVVTAVVQRPAAVEAAPQDQPGPVLLVPGYGGTGDLRAQAEHLGEVAAAVLAETGARSVDVVGYSAGGVVARLWVRDEGGAGLARRVLTLGSPQHGTSQAALGASLAGGCPVACEQLVPDSDVLRRLNAGDETPDGPLWATVRTTTDRVVTPVESAALDGALNVVVQDVCPGSTAGHPDLPRDPVVRATLTSVLGPAPPRSPSDVVC